MDVLCSQFVSLIAPCAMASSCARVHYPCQRLQIVFAICAFSRLVHVIIIPVKVYKFVFAICAFSRLVHVFIIPVKVYKLSLLSVRSVVLCTCSLFLSRSTNCLCYLCVQSSCARVHYSCQGLQIRLYYLCVSHSSHEIKECTSLHLFVWFYYFTVFCNISHYRKSIRSTACPTTCPVQRGAVHLDQGEHEDSQTKTHPQTKG